MSKTGVLLKDRRFGTAERCEESATPFQGADSRVVKVFQGYAKNAYPWVISQHRSAVRAAVYGLPLQFTSSRAKP